MLATRTINITLAAASDMTDLLSLLNQNNLPTDGLDDRVLTTTVVAKVGDEVVGSAALEIHGDTALLRSVAVAAPLRGQGWGQRLTEAALELARVHGMREVYLLTETAGQFFPRFGFVPISRDAVAAAIQQSAEFTISCPTSALVLRLKLAA